MSKTPDYVKYAASIVPSERQIKWQELEFYSFIHFGMNTFTNSEWGNGNDDPELFNPEKLDCRQWAKVCQLAGMKGMILTAKHHDGVVGILEKIFGAGYCMSRAELFGLVIKQNV